MGVKHGISPEGKNFLSENRIQRRIFGSKREEAKGAVENYVTRSTHEEEEKCM
jgi:hypothetical protein